MTPTQSKGDNFMKLDFDYLIQTVAERHRFILTKDDPLLAAVSMNEVVFEIHSKALIEKMDEQNARMIAALQAALNNSKADAKNERDKFTQIVNAVHQKHLLDLKRLLDDQLNSTANYVNEMERSKNSSWTAVLITFGIAIVLVCANLHILFSK